MRYRRRQDNFTLLLLFLAALGILAASVALWYFG